MPQIVVPLTVRDLAARDLASCAWAGLTGSGLITELERADRGDADYLVVCPPSGLPVALGGVDYAANRRAGTLYQLTVHGALQSCGIGTILPAPGRTGRRRTQPAGPCCMTGSATTPTAAPPNPGTNRRTTEPSTATRLCPR
jgi:hypothetical protein